jgi:hypothetical protein
MRRPTPALVISIIALFVALSGAAWAATGGSFILGNPNAADATSTLSAPVAGGGALNVANGNTAAGSTALKLQVASGHPPLSVNSGVKVPNLNADELDGMDSTRFAQGKGAQIVSARVTSPVDACCPWHPVMAVPGFGELKGQCISGLGSYMYFFYSGTSDWLALERYNGASPAVVVSPGGATDLQDGREGGGHFTVELGRGTASAAVNATLDVYTNWDATNGCIWQAQAVLNQGLTPPPS